MGVNISAKFGKNDELYNGLTHIEDELHDEPGLVRTAVVSYRVKFGKRDYENGGAESLTIRIVEFEPLDGSAAVDAKELQRTAFKARTGNPMQDDLFSSQDTDDPGE